MGRSRKKKLLIIIILLVAVTSLSVGLATFSNVLTISSRATVKPNDGEYNVKIYGLSSVPEDLNNTNITSAEALLSYFSSNTIGMPFGLLGGIGTPAVIDNNSFSISNIQATFTGSVALPTVVYLFMIRNEGAYDVYLDLAPFENYSQGIVSKNCTAGNETSQDLANEYCANLVMMSTLTNSVGEEIFKEYDFLSSYRIGTGDFVVLTVTIAYAKLGNVQEDFTAQFEDISLQFNATDIYAS